MKANSVLIFIVIICILCVFSKSDDNTINVHFVTHTHDDLGWVINLYEFYLISKIDN